ncbi:phosphonate ABC transporter, permease protein PhnE [Herbaspirillum robiniae]|uniref:Phosphonate ABC transporter, permease protein PhnE n=1 Tax=Herbaspirillum robiniae TaxID=2014887 RepID=A0A246WPJ2_9BURK|nr:phosphonate ABC transporter, permease protein PhnE [Herbaspirillum robiniae]NUU04493.1 phosphonate ABC transporter, permease protein PhnE [Herbaspirillum robiniae]OWY28302.1 phosphonate ABC transporter, permease protein PhnE [Herbaspirillum robiniae]
MSDTALRNPQAMGNPAEREWQRHTPLQRVLRFTVWLVIALAVVQSLRYIEIIPEFLYDAPEQMSDMLGRMWPIDWAYFGSDVKAGLIETLHIATLGTLLSIVLAIPFGLLVAPNLTRHRGLNLFARIVLVASRSVNSLVWALLFLAIFGPGPLAGTLAIAFRSIGFVGKMAGETIEQMPRGPIEALQASGASKFSEIWYGYWPQLKPAFMSIVLLRWDINVRESAVLGIVGAGGVGMVLDTALNLFQWPRVATVLVSIFAIVIVTEVVVTQIRKRVL